MWIGFYQQIATWFYFNDWIKYTKALTTIAQREISYRKRREKKPWEHWTDSKATNRIPTVKWIWKLTPRTINIDQSKNRKSKKKCYSQNESNYELPTERYDTIQNGEKRERERAGAEPGYMVALGAFVIIKNRLISVQFVRLLSHTYIQCHIITFVM